MARKRMAVVFILDFALAVFSKTQRSRSDGPVVLVDTLADTAPVIAANQKAQTTGILCGITVAQAEAFCPGLTVFQRDETTERVESHTIVSWLGSLSPLVNEETPGRYLLDASGLSLLYPDEQIYAERMIVTLHPLGYAVQVGIARNPFVARVAAERAEPSGYLVIPSGQEKSFLNKLERQYLTMSDDTASLLHDLGVEQIAHLAAFPANEMTERFGAEGTLLSTRARGEDTAVALTQKENNQDDLTATRFFSSPLQQAQQVDSHLARLLSILLEQLKLLGQGCACVDVTLHLDNRTDQTITLAVANPTLSSRPFLRQWQTQIEFLSLQSGISGLTVTIPHLMPLLMEQLALPTHRSAVSAPAALPASVCFPHLRPGILPETCFDLVPWSSSKWRHASPLDTTKNDAALSGVEGRQCSGVMRSRLTPSFGRWHISGLRLLPRPRSCRLQLDHGRPSQIIWNGMRRIITEALGPWELSGSWWSRVFNRKYYEIATDDCRRYLVFHDEEDLLWYLQGVFD